MATFDATAVRLDIPSRIDMLGIASVLVGEFARTAGSPEGSVRDIEGASHEAVANAIVHGNQENEMRRVTLELAVHPGELRIRVRDEGSGFDVSAVPYPIAPENLCRPSGRGIFLVRALMDEVVFENSASGGTEVTMLKRFPSAPEGH